LVDQVNMAGISRPLRFKRRKEIMMLGKPLALVFSSATIKAMLADLDSHLDEIKADPTPPNYLAKPPSAARSAGGGPAGAGRRGGRLALLGDDFVIVLGDRALPRI
jgi:hypothetical protein